MSPKKKYGEDRNGNYICISTSKEGTSKKRRHMPSTSRISPLFIPVPDDLIDKVPVVSDRAGGDCIAYLVRDHEARLLRDITWKSGITTEYKGTNMVVHLIQGQPVSSEKNIALLIDAAREYGARRR